MRYYLLSICVFANCLLGYSINITPIINLKDTFITYTTSADKIFSATLPSEAATTYIWQ